MIGTAQQTPTSNAADQTHKLLRRARALRISDPERSARLQAEAVGLNMDMARGIALRYAGRGIPVDDLIQVAYLGLVQAARRFDPDRSARFTDFAAPTIRGEVRRHFRDAGWTVRPPRRLQELQMSIRSAEEDLIQQLHRSPNPTEIARHLDADVAEVVEAMAIEGCFAPSSLDAPVTLDGRAAMDSLADDTGEFTAAEARLVLGPALERLKPRDRLIVELRFYRGLTQREVGESLGVTQMQVSRLLGRILRDLRRDLRTVAAPPCDGEVDIRTPQG